MKFIGFDQLYQDVLSYSQKIPDVDAILGIPRSGMLPATMLASLLSKPLGVLNSDGSFDLLRGGSRSNKPETFRRFLALDDSTDSGHTLDQLRRVSMPGINILFGAIYYSENSPKRSNDFYGRLIQQPRMFAWNFMNHGLLEKACVDIDGVLCRDPVGDECDWGQNYENFLNTVPVKYSPKFKIGNLVTGRLEEYRKQTEEWMKNKGIIYDKLIMRDSAKTDIGEMKKNFYKDSGSLIFIESSEEQAIQISEVGPVICTDNLTLYDSTR